MGTSHNAIFFSFLTTFCFALLLLGILKLQVAWQAVVFWGATQLENSPLRKMLMKEERY